MGALSQPLLRHSGPTTKSSEQRGKCGWGGAFFSVGDLHGSARSELGKCFALRLRRQAHTNYLPAKRITPALAAAGSTLRADSPAESGAALCGYDDLELPFQRDCR